MSFLVHSVAGTFNAGNLVASDAAGTTTNGFVLTLVAGVPTWLAVPGGTAAVVFDNTVAQVNIRSNRLTNQQPIDNTFVGITCFGSLTAGVNTIKGDYSTIGGGNRNGIGTAGASTHGTVAGGLVNTIGSGSNHCTISGGFNNAINDASGDDSTISGGVSNIISKPTATIGGGTGNVVGGTSATVSGGNANAANGDFSHVPGGLTNQATGNAACAVNRSSLASGNQAFAHGMAGSATRSGQYSHGAGSPGNTRYGRVLYTGSLVAGSLLTTELLYGADLDKFTPENNKAYALFVEMVVAQNGIGVGVPASAVLTLFTTMASDMLSANVNVSAFVAIAAAVGDATLATCTLTATIVLGKLKLTLTGPVAGPALIVAATMRFTEITHT
jgi:hypothetical protein